MLNTSNVEIVTDGIFLNNLNKYLTYEYIIIDEVHERSAKTDLILGILKQKLKNKLILMSATINTRIFEKYFDGKVFEIIGQSYKANIIYESVDDYIIGSFLKIKEIVSNENDKQNNKNSVHTNKHHKQLQVKNNDDEKNGTLIDKCNLQKSSTCSDNKDVDNVIDEIFDTKTPAEFDATNKNGDILVFLTGEEDINELYKLVRTIPQIKAYKIHSLLSDKKQNEIFEHTPLTKVILSTNICETSITIPGIKYVIDCGLAKEKIYNGCLHLGIKKIGKDNADQRKGRCNRTSDGVCYRLYEEDTYKKMVHSQPEIEKCDVSDIILILMYYNYNVFEFPFITFANMHNAKEAILYLLYIKAIEYKQDANTFTITRYGKKLVKNPVDTKLSHFLEICKNKKIKILGIALISIICQEQTDLLSIESRYESDIEEYLCVLQDYLNTDKNITNKFSSVQIRFLEKAKNIFVQLSKRKGFEYTKEELYELERAYSSAFSCNVLIRQDNGSYIGKMGTVYLFPTSNFYKKRIKKIVCVNVWNTKKCYAQFVGRFIED